LANLKGEFKRKLRRAANTWWKSLQLGASAGLEIGIRQEGKSASVMRLPQALRQADGGFHILETRLESGILLNFYIILFLAILRCRQT
jgi:hypothetical protein